MLHLCINMAKWNELPPHYKAIMRQACEAANNWMLAKYDAVNSAALSRLLVSGIKLRAFPVETIDAAYKAATEFYAEASAKNPLFKKGYESMVAFRKENYTWWQVGEYSYDSYIIRAIRG